MGKIEYHTITDMSSVAHYAGQKGIIAKEDYEKVKAYENNPHDESWLSESASAYILNKRLGNK